MNYRKIDNWKKLPELVKLKDLPSPPKSLYFAGRWSSEIFKNCTAVVGSRRITEYGKRVIEKIIPQLIFQKKTIVSGFMYGVDQYAHKICLDNGGKTIAVLGWGINYKLTGYDLKLAQKIITSGGLLLSEWEDQRPTLWTFPVRNRIVACLCSEVIIIEAAAQSGSLITARIAAKLNRKIWAVPGPITSKTSVGTNGLILSGKAQMWVDKQELKDAKREKDPLLNLLQNEALTTDEIARKLDLPVSKIGAQLSLLEISGQLSQKGGKYFLNNAN